MGHTGRPLSHSEKEPREDLPNGYQHGFCNDCKRKFKPDPRMTRQFICKECRVVPGSDFKQTPLAYQHVQELRLRKGFIYLIAGDHEAKRELAKKIGVARDTMIRWSKQGFIPGYTGSADKFCEAIGLTREQVKERWGR